MDRGYTKELEAFEEVKRDMDDFFYSMVKREPYILSPFDEDEKTTKFLKERPDDREKLINRFGCGLYLNRAVRVICHKKFRDGVNSKWMSQAYNELFNAIKMEIPDDILTETAECETHEYNKRSGPEDTPL